MGCNGVELSCGSNSSWAGQNGAFFRYRYRWIGNGLASHTGGSFITNNTGTDPAWLLAQPLNRAGSCSQAGAGSQHSPGTGRRVPAALGVKAVSSGISGAEVPALLPLPPQQTQLSALQLPAGARGRRAGKGKLQGMGKGSALRESISSLTKGMV